MATRLIRSMSRLSIPYEDDTEGDPVTVRLLFTWGSRKYGPNFYETMLDDGGVSVAGQMAFMGHSHKSKVITTAVYGHVTGKDPPDRPQRGRRDTVRGAPVPANGTMAELETVR